MGEHVRPYMVWTRLGLRRGEFIRSNALQGTLHRVEAGPVGEQVRPYKFWIRLGPCRGEFIRLNALQGAYTAWRLGPWSNTFALL